MGAFPIQCAPAPRDHVQTALSANCTVLQTALDRKCTVYKLTNYTVYKLLVTLFENSFFFKLYTVFKLLLYFRFCIQIQVYRILGLDI